jgi:hypothetical protein
VQEGGIGQCASAVCTWMHKQTQGTWRRAKTSCSSRITVRRWGTDPHRRTAATMLRDCPCGSPHHGKAMRRGWQQECAHQRAGAALPWPTAPCQLRLTFTKRPWVCANPIQLIVPVPREGNAQTRPKPGLLTLPRADRCPCVLSSRAGPYCSLLWARMSWRSQYQVGLRRGRSGPQHQSDTCMTCRDAGPAPCCVRLPRSQICYRHSLDQACRAGAVQAVPAGRTVRHRGGTRGAHTLRVVQLLHEGI